VEGLDRDRALNLRPTVVVAFYDMLSKAYQANPYRPHKIWNCDETGIQEGRNGVPCRFWPKEVAAASHT